MIESSTRSIVLEEWSTYPAANDGPIDYRLISGVDPLTLARFNDSGVISINDYRTGIVVKSTSFVGKVRIGNLDITVQPKIAPMLFLRLLRYSYGLRNLQMYSEIEFATEQLSFIDLLIYQLLLETEELIARGLRREYILHDEPLKSPRGRINISRIALQGGITSAALPCTHHDRSNDILINCLLTAGIYLAAGLVGPSWLRARLYRAHSVLRQSVRQVPIDRSAVVSTRLRVNRLTRVYEPALTLIELLTEQQGVSFADTDSKVTLNGFVFDMNRFFQSLLSRFLHDFINDYTLRDEHRLTGVMQYDPANNPRSRRAPAPRPDFVLLREGTVAAILDAKYRNLWNLPLPREMLYQLAIYALSQSKQRIATILYPTVDTNAREARIAISDPLHDGLQATVALRPVDLGQMDRLIAGSRIGGDLGVARTFALYMAFGPPYL